WALGLYSSLDACAGGYIHAANPIQYDVHWTIEDDGLAHDPVLSVNDKQPKRGWTDSEVRIFEECSRSYLDAHPTMQLEVRDAMNTEMDATMQTSFPISEMPVYRFIREQSSD